MIVPAYWAEGRRQHKAAGRQVTVRRFGWSDTSQADAQAHADARADEGLRRVLAGEQQLPRREPKLPYHGAEGMPIREEIVARHGATVVTRNSYGARCLNTPDVFFADIDFPHQRTTRMSLAVYLGLLVLAAVVGRGILDSALAMVALLVAAWFLAGRVSRRVNAAMQVPREQLERKARDDVLTFCGRHPDWNLHVYRTPAGLRLLATHRSFDPGEPAVKEAFDALHVDPVYVLMCQNQCCFRARVSGKPWRMGLAEHIRPRPGVWPVAAEHLPRREAWVARYEERARGFAACRWIEGVGSGAEHPDAQAVRELHDALCSARSEKPLA